MSVLAAFHPIAFSELFEYAVKEKLLTYGIELKIPSPYKREQNAIQIASH